MDASVIIITKNQKYILQESLPIILKQSFPGKYEVIVVDSGSVDGAKEYARSLGVKVVEIKPQAFNFANAFNIGARTARGKYLVRLSGDVIPLGRSWLKEIVRPFSDPKVGATYGRYTVTGKKGWGYPDFWPAGRFPDKITRYSVTPTVFMGFNLFGNDFGNPKIREYVFNLAGGCCAIRRDIWLRRSFNEELIAGEDAEYAWFLHLAGYDIVCNPQARAIHEHKTSQSMRNSLLASIGITKWQWVFNWQIAKYWLQRMAFIDPFKSVRIN